MLFSCGGISPEIALKRNSRVCGSSNKIEADSVPMRVAASLIINFSNSSTDVVELSWRLISSIRAKRWGPIAGENESSMCFTYGSRVKKT